MTVLDAHFATSTNVLVDRHRFRQKRQAPNEAFEACAASLRKLASSCDYGDGFDNVIRDQLLDGTTSRQIRKRLLYEGSTLTLQRTLDIGRHIEQIQREIHEFGGYASVQRVAPKKTEKSTSTKRCGYRCGSQTHRANYDKCPAKNKRCRRCKKIGHFEAVCKSSEMSSVQAVKDPNSAEANVVTVLHIGDDYRRARETSTEVLIGNVPIRFLVDTGATVSLLSEEDYRKNLSGRYPLSAKSVVVQNYTKEEMPSVGCFLVDVTYRNKDACVMFHVTKRGISLLGLDAIRNIRINIEGETLSCCQAAPSPTSTLLPSGLREELGQLFFPKSSDLLKTSCTKFSDVRRCSQLRLNVEDFHRLFRIKSPRQTIAWLMPCHGYQWKVNRSRERGDSLHCYIMCNQGTAARSNHSRC
ncbi:uncharacterized protein LOC120847486 [Ixodes scapularis]|uniref:uncharacterized protein LOC120847486 n=1 Tax=Ixodes scapularis TaxID=6945 RepID=UPI001A9EFDFD|nr:uncharacterized protein LOC120847486 [Ixodes scapularis]